MELVLDAEFTVQDPQAKDKKGSPYYPTNKLVSVQYKFTGVSFIMEDCIFFNHNELEGSGYERKDPHKALQIVLDQTTLMIGHNVKADLSWLRECGFTYEGKIWDTMNFEYLQAKGMKPGLSLEDSAERRNLDSRKSEFMANQFKLGVNVDAMPIHELREYAMLDIYTTEELYHFQKNMVDADSIYMLPALDLMNDFTEVLTDMERSGINIDRQALQDLKLKYTLEYNRLQYMLQELAQEVMGDTPVNLDSPEHISQVLYGFKVKDKEDWAEAFNIGSEMRNGVKKKKYNKRLSDAKVDRFIKDLTIPLYKTEAHQCPDCGGRGYITKFTKKGVPHKRDNKCKTCNTSGVIYKDTKDRAGFRIGHPGAAFATINGFSGGGDAIELLLERVRGRTNLSAKAQKAVDFIQGLSKINAISTYLNSFIKGIEENTLNGYLHTNFNQCITATGRLSSTKPNFQNLPRASTFPLRKVITSRFDGGYILSCDLAQLEFRVAAFLSQCPDAIQFILDGRDIHMVSAQFFFPNQEITPDMRQEAKAETFGPLFGKQGEYTEHFYRNFPGIRKWHDRLCEEALNTKQVRSPSGRIYAYPYAQRNSNGSVSPFTQIVNYIVQGFATGDIMPSICVEIYREMKKRRMKSRLILTVHDDLTADIHPDEKEEAIEIFKQCFGSVKEQCKRRFNVDINVPIDYELSIGPNWLEKTKIKI